MSDSLFSTYWYRVANLKPVLREGVVISRHIFRGQTWYVLRNSLSGRNHRFNAAAYALIARMDGRQTVQELWEQGCNKLDSVVPTQDEMIRLLGQLYDADLIQSNILPSTVELFRQVKALPKQGLKERMSNPFSLRFPLWDPDRFLERWGFLTTPLFTRGALVCWFLILLGAVVLAVMHWPELSGSRADQLFSTTNLLLLWVTYPLIKVHHEFGHAFAVKKWGGEVHEMGILLLALTPIPYVDATASASFPEKGSRIAVAAMGLMVELLLASLALFVWVNVETGLISALAYNIMVIGGVSTVVFNGNPLLRYDGYYILADLAEIPNLGQRSTGYLGYLLQRYLLGIETVESPVTAPGEKVWFLIYGPVSFCYRLAVVVGLVWMVSSRFFFVGVLIALWGAVTLLILPLFRGISRFLDMPTVRKKRFRLLAFTGGITLGLAFLLFAFPMRLWTSTQGVVWLPEQSVIRAGTDCEITKVLAPVDQAVAKDQPLIRGEDSFLEAEVAVYKARLKELYARYNALELRERVKRNMVLEEIERIKADLRQTEDRRDKLLIRSPVQGKLVLIDARNLPGRFVKQGELLGYIIAEHHPTVRAVVRQDDIGLVRERVTGVEVRLAEQPEIALAAHIKRIVPAAELNLPSPALGTAGGGIIPVDPTDAKGLRPLESLFQLDLSLPDAVKEVHVGERVYVRFEHGSMPVAFQWYRNLRQLFIRKFYG